MAGYSHLAIIILTVFVNGCWCRSWPNLQYWILKEAGWEMSNVAGVNSLDFVDNFMIPCRHDPKQIMVGNGHGYSPSTGEGCIQIYYLRNRNKSVKKLAGKCSRHIPSNFNYNDGKGLNARIMWPDHGYITKDGIWLLFVDNQSCARKMKMTDNFVTTVIGQCSSGTLDLSLHGQARTVIGMVYLDEKDFWVFSVQSGLYIYSWSGDFKRKVANRDQMSNHHNWNSAAGLITKSTHDNFQVFQKVQFGVTSYNFSGITLTNHTFSNNDLRPDKLFSLRPSPDPSAMWKYSAHSSWIQMGSGNGHVSQHPYYRELLMVADWNMASIYILNTDDGKISKYCKGATGTPYIITSTNVQSCRFTSLKSTMWVGGKSLSALVVDRTSWLIHKLILVNNKQTFNSRCMTCYDGAGYSSCYDTRDGSIKCVCIIGYEGPKCESQICRPYKCNGNGVCSYDNSNTGKCVCNNGWRGETCNIQRTLALEYVGGTVIELAQGSGSKFTARLARIGEGFLLKKFSDPSVFIVGHRYWNKNKEGAIGYYRQGHFMKFFINLAGSLSRTRGPNKYNDGIGSGAHMVQPMFGVQQLNGKWLHFVDSWSCARRLNLKENLQVYTWIGLGRCGNGTLDLAVYGTQRKVAGMTMLEFTGKSFFVFSGPFGIYVYSWNGNKKRRVVETSQASFYSADIDVAGSLTKRSPVNTAYVYHNTAYGITRYNFDQVSATNKKPGVKRIASLKPHSPRLFPQKDDMATHNYDHNQPVTFGDQGGIIAINPHYDDILMVADHGKGSVIIYNITSGNKLSVCKKDLGPHESIWLSTNAATCRWVLLKSAMWLTQTTALISDYWVNGKVYKINFKIGVNACASNPCGHGICSDLSTGYHCSCDDNWSGSTCSISTPRTNAVFPALGEDDVAGHLMSIGTSGSETFPVLIITASLTPLSLFN